MRRVGAIAFGAAISLSLAQFAWADPTPTELQAARDLFSKAEKDEDAGNWNEALDKLRRAASVKATPGIRFHIALCEDKLGQLVAALSDYAAADQAARDTNNKDVMDAVAEPLKSMRVRVPTLTIEVPNADNVRVELDGKPIAAGLFGLAVPVEPGVHRVVAHATGKRVFSTQVQLREREATTASVKWIAEVVEAQTQETAEKPVERESSGSFKTGALVATISAVALLGFGIGAYVAADGAHGNLAAQCPTLVDCSDLRTQVRAWDTAALVSWIASAGVATIAIVLWAKPSHASSSTRGRIEIRPGGFALSGTF